MTTKHCHREFQSGREIFQLVTAEHILRLVVVSSALLVDTGSIGCSEGMLLLQDTSLELERKMMVGWWSLLTWRKSQ